MIGTPISDDELHAYADGQLAADRIADVEAWLQQTPEDRARIDDWRLQLEAIRTAMPLEPESAVPDRLRAVLRARPVRSELQGNRPGGMFARAAAIAAIAFIAGFAAARVLGPESVAPTATGSSEAVAVRTALSTETVNMHRLYVGEVRHPVEVSANEEQHLVKWLTKRVGSDVTVPNLAAEGLKLVGGRLVPLAGGPGALLMYETAGGERFTLFVLRNTGGETTAFRYGERDGLGTFYWLEPKGGYALVGPADKPRLLKLANRIYKELP